MTAAAMRQVAERGPHAVAFTASSASTIAIGDSTGFIQRLTNAFGAPNAVAGGAWRDASAVTDRLRQTCRAGCERRGGFATPSRKVEFFSQIFLEPGYLPLPEFAEPQIGPVAWPDLLGRFPLILTNAKPSLFYQTQHRALRSLHKRSPHPEVELHPSPAEARGVANGDWMTIETPEGVVRARARLNDSLAPANCPRRARILAGLCRDRPAQLRPVRYDGGQFQPADRYRRA